MSIVVSIEVSRVVFGMVSRLLARVLSEVYKVKTIVWSNLLRLCIQVEFLSKMIKLKISNRSGSTTRRTSTL